MAHARRPPYEVVLSHFKYCVGALDLAVGMRGKTPHWTDEAIGRRREELRFAGQMVRSMALRPSERDAALGLLKKDKKRIEALLASYGRGTMNKRWFGYVLRRVAQQ